MKKNRFLSLVLAVMFIAATLIAAVPLTAYAANMISIEKTTYAPGESIAVSVMDSSQLVKGYSIIFLYNAGAKHGDWLGGQWRYYDGTTFPAFNAPNTPGNYEIRLYLDSGGDKYSDATCVTTLSFKVSDGSTPTPVQPTGGKGWYFSHVEFVDASYDYGNQKLSTSYDSSSNSVHSVYDLQGNSFNQATYWEQVLSWSAPPSYLPAGKEVTLFALVNKQVEVKNTAVKEVHVAFHTDRASKASDTPNPSNPTDYAWNFGYTSGTGKQNYVPADGASYTLTGTLPNGTFDGYQGYVLLKSFSVSSSDPVIRFVYVWRESGTVTPPVTPPGDQTAAPTSSKVLVNGIEVAFDAYNIGGNNYFKLRDIAYALSGSNKQFEVSWDGANNAISLVSGKAYTSVGGEMQGKGSGNKTASPTSSKIYLNGIEVKFTAYNIEGNNYFKLRDIGETFDFNVSWNGAANTIIIDTSQSYTPD